MSPNLRGLLLIKIFKRSHLLWPFLDMLSYFPPSPSLVSLTSVSFQFRYMNCPPSISISSFSFLLMPTGGIFVILLACSISYPSPFFYIVAFTSPFSRNEDLFLSLNETKVTIQWEQQWLRMKLSTCLFQKVVI